MASKNIEVVVMFVDVTDSTGIYERRGDAEASGIISECLNNAIQVIDRHGGVVIKTMGDEVMCSFQSAQQGAEAACGIHEKLVYPEDWTATGGVRLSVKIGMHYGPVIVEDDDLFGDTVNIAARLASLAKATQTITTKETIDLLAPVLRASTRLVDRTSVRGKSDVIAIYEILWQQEDVTFSIPIGVMDKEENIRLELRVGDHTYRLDDDNTGLVIGRGRSCDVIMDKTLISREHARIARRRDKFYLVDESTNGTYVREAGAEEIFVRRDELRLYNQGEISPGYPFKENPDDTIFYSIIMVGDGGTDNPSEAD